MASPASTVYFGAVDYVILLVTLGLSLSVGIYYHFKGKNTTEDFLLAGRSMSTFPVSLSLVATHISSISFLGYIGEVYGHGITLIWSLLGIVVGMGISAHVFQPVLYALNLKSIYEYPQLRFKSRWLAKTMTLVTVLTHTLFSGLCLFAPTLALSTVTPLSIKTYILVLGAVVTLYATIGGMKAVVWTDAIQTIIMVLGVLIATVAALIQAGGIFEVIRINTEHGRNNALVGGLGLTTRHTSFNTFIMASLKFLFYYSFSQPTLQRTMTMPNVKRVQILIYLSSVGLAGLIAILFFAGMCIFSIYATCDPMSLGFIRRKDQIFPYYVMDRLSFMTGIPALVVACLISGTMSTVSTLMNSTPTLIWADFLSELQYFKQASERTRTLFTKLLTGVLGGIMIGLAFLTSQFGGLIQAHYTILAILNGPSIGIFVLGICMPFVTTKGAVAGYLSSVVVMAWISIGVQMYGSKPQLLPLSTDGCDSFNLTVTEAPMLNTSTITSVLRTTTNVVITNATTATGTTVAGAGVYNLSYTYLAVVGAVCAIVVGVLVSLITGMEDLGDVDPRHVLSCFKNMVGHNLPNDAGLEGNPMEDMTKASESAKEPGNSSATDTKVKSNQSADGTDTCSSPQRTHAQNGYVNESFKL